MDKLNNNIQWIVYLLAAVFYGFLLLLEALWWVGTWAAFAHPVLYIVLLAPIGLFCAALYTFKDAHKAKIIAIASVLLLGIIYIPATDKLVPAHNIIVSVDRYLLLSMYFALLIFVLFFPKKTKRSFLILILTLIVSVGVFVSTYAQRKAMGEYAWPKFVFYSLNGETKINTQENLKKFISQDYLNFLEQNNIRGTLSFNGGDGTERNSTVVVICSNKISEEKKLYFPKQGNVLYVYDGTKWLTFPESFEQYERYVTLRPDGMLSQELLSEGTQSYRVYSGW